MASAIWKGHLTFGLVSIPVKLFRAARAEKIHMHHIQRQTGARVRQVFVPSSEEPAPPAESRAAPSAEKVHVAAHAGPSENDAHPASRHIPKSELVKGFEYEKDKYVAFEPGELENLAPAKSDQMQIVEFVKFSEVDPVYLESSYYVAAGPGGARPYALLFEALKKTGYAAVAEFVMHRRDQTIILRPGRTGIVAHTLFYEDEVKRENEFHADAGAVNEKEMDLAVRLVGALAAEFEPGKFKDKYRERLQSAISKKMETGTTTEARPATRHAPVVDIMAALKESLEKAKKPAASESKPAAKHAAGGKHAARRSA